MKPTAHLFAYALLALTPLAGPVRAQDATDAFPASTALAEGVSPDGLAALDALVRGFVEDGEAVGAELHVIKSGRTILHEAYGWRDREGEVRMEPDTVFCVRSMTKPLVGTAVRMLVADGLLALDDAVAEYLPSFDTDATRAITVEHLLMHTSGLPMSLIMTRDPRALEGVRAVADLGGGRALDFEPGAAFQYSDQGTDTATALIEVVTGVPAEQFLAERVLSPLGMVDSTCHMTADHRLRARVAAKYTGTPGSWTRYWAPEDPPLFGCFLGSQGLYSTTTDYARFLQLWMDRGRVGRERLLRPMAVRHTLTPGPHPLRAPTGFPGLEAAYGSLMQLWTRPGEDGEAEVVAFGHTGSDGTHAWAFPDQDALVLYFTQSRGTGTGLRVEEQLGDLFLGVPFDPLQVAPPLEEYLGYYREDEDDKYRAIVLDGDGLALEVLGRAVATLVYVGEDRWKLRDQPGTVLAFHRDGDGRVEGFRIDDHQEWRFEPADDLPPAEELAARVARVHGLDRLEQLGTLRLEGDVRIERLDRTGASTTWLQWPDRWRTDEAAGDEVASTAYDGEHVRMRLAGADLQTLEGEASDLLADASTLARLGDWTRRYPELQTVQRLTPGDDDVYLVRAGGTDHHAPTFYVDAVTGRVGRVERMAYVPGMGRVGAQLTFDDFRTVEGVLLPFETTLELANPMIGPIVTTLRSAAIVEAPPEGFFELVGER